MSDPAVLLYTSDFLTGVIDMTMEERGQYITLLCYQHQKGHFSDETTRLLVGLVSVSVMKHFVKDKEGLYFNKRMDIEKEKRQVFAESRRKNGKKGGRPSSSNNNHKDNHMDNLSGTHMGNDNDNENRDINIIEYFNNNIHLITPIEIDEINILENNFSLGLIKKAIQIAVNNNARSMAYISRILENWKSKGYKTLADIEQDGKKQEEPNNQEELFDYDWLHENEEEN
jgi:DnaD/phage-associated family protein